MVAVAGLQHLSRLETTYARTFNFQRLYCSVMQTERLRRPATPDPKRWLGTLLLAVVVFAVSRAYFGTVPRLEPPITSPTLELLHELDFALWWEWYLLVGIVVVAVVVFGGRSLGRVSVLVAAAMAGLGSTATDMGMSSNPPPFPWVRWVLVLTLVGTPIVVGAGYALGRVGRRLLGRETEGVGS